MVKKKILIIKPPFQAFPMGFAYVLACLSKNGIPFDFVDMTLPFRDYRKNLRKKDYLAVASGGLIGQFGFFNEVVRWARKINPGLPIILGGNITKDIKHDFLFDKIGIDFGVLGEAEISLPRLINSIANGQNDFFNIPGIIYKEGSSGKIIGSIPHRINLENENMLPAWQYFDLDYYSPKHAIPFHGYRSCMPVLTGRGCIGQCAFCSPSIGSFRVRPIRHVMEEMEFLNSNYNFEWFNICNEMAYQAKEQMLNFCEAYKKLKVRKPWVCSVRADASFDKETFILMKESGCAGMSVGIESGSNRVLKLMRKGTTVEQVKGFYRTAREIGLECNGTFMIGNEGETEKEIRETIDMVINEEMNSDDSLTLAYPGTQVYKNALERGLIADEWEYLCKLRFGCGIWEWGWTDRTYLNITDIPQEIFWDVIVNESRYYNTSLFNRYQAKNSRFKFMFKTSVIGARGLCPHCGGKVVLYPPFIFLEMMVYCPKCFCRVYFNIYNQKRFSRHFDLLREELHNAKKIVISGTGPEAAAFLRINRFSIDYSKIKGFLEVKPQTIRNDIFINKPRIELNSLHNVKPDLIFIVDDKNGNSELLIRQSYLTKSLNVPKMLHLYPGPGPRHSLSLLLYIIRRSIIKVRSSLCKISRIKPRRLIAKRIIHQLGRFYLQISDLSGKVFAKTDIVTKATEND